MSTVDWSKLPHDPRGFFDLPDDFDRGRLKRQYGKLIKIYKPETAPGDFQRIRAAYEILEARIRYGRIQESVPPALESPWPTSAHTTAPVLRRHTAPEDPPRTDAKAAASSVRHIDARPLHERLQSQSVTELYQQLRQQAEKSPYDYFALALLSDAIRPDGQLFYRWLLEGVKAYPTDMALYNLLFEYLRTDLPVASIPGLLLATSHIFANDQFYFLTEAAWHRLLVHATFPAFRETLDKCEANLQDFRTSGKLAFYIQILPRAIWKAEPEWIQQSFNWLDASGVHVPQHLESDRDFLDVLKLYHDHLPALQQNPHPLFQQIVENLQQYFLSEGLNRDRLVIQGNLELADQPQALLEAFPIDDRSDAQPLWLRTWILWQMISQDVAERNGLHDASSSRQPLDDALGKIVRDQDQTWNSWVGLRSAHRLVQYSIYPAALVTPWVLLGGVASALFPISGGFMLTASLAAVAFYHFYLRITYVEPFWEEHMGRHLADGYRRQARPRLLQLLEENPVPMSELLSAMRTVCAKTGAPSRGQAVQDFLEEDIGVAFFSTAVRFRR
jgi:hypothetical protein